MNGMADNEDEHNFSDDDDFGNLADETLRELEHKAILSTQQEQRLAAGAKVSPTKVLAQNATYYANVLPHLQHAITDGFEHDGFEAVEEERVRTPVEHVRQLIPQQYRPPGETTQREQARLQKYGTQTKYNPPQAPQQQHHSSGRNLQRLASPDEANGLSRNFSGTLGSTLANGPAQARTASTRDSVPTGIEELMQEREKLMAQLKDAKDQVMTKMGEISIIRDNKDKETKVYERQLGAMKKSMQEESARHKAAIETLTSKHNALVTEYNMTKDDLKEETRRIKSLETRLKEKSNVKSDDLLVTPKKQRPANSLRDGFDDDEIMVVSPAKSASRRSKPTTPVAATKRKRKVDPSPVKPLSLRQSEDLPQQSSGSGQHQQASTTGIVPTVRKAKQTERHLRLIQMILNYQPRARRERLVEVLVAFSFPSDQRRAFSSIVLDAVSHLQGSTLPTDLLQIFIDMWAQSLKEKYYDCIALLMEVVDHIIDVQTSVIDKTTISNLLAVLQDSATINGSARFKHSPVYRGNFGQFRQTPVSALNPLVNTTACLALLYKVAGLSMVSEPLIDHFWRSMSTDFVLMMLNSWQPISDITLMLQLLETSIFRTTFGNICPDPSTQNTMETHIINRVTYLLWETPKVDEGLPSLSRSDLCRFRLEALALLSTLAIDSSLPPHDDPHHHGSILLASHPSAIARLVRTLYDSMASLYLLTSSSALYAQMINQGVRLLYHLMTQHGEEIQLQQKLAAVNGGVYKHRVVLTRLAFSEGWIIDCDVTDETCAMATAMLEDSVTPDEAEMMIQAFPGFSGRKMDRGQDQIRSEDSAESGN